MVLNGNIHHYIIVDLGVKTIPQKAGLAGLKLFDTHSRLGT